MSNYVQSTNFATKDALSSGDPLKIVKGTEINTEFNNIATAVATKADLVSPTLVNPALGTPVSGNLANCTFPALNAATATALQNARTIGGVSFNGTANINLPGVNQGGNQNTTGTSSGLVSGSSAVSGSDNEWFISSVKAGGGSIATFARNGITRLDVFADGLVAIEAGALSPGQQINFVTNGTGTTGGNRSGVVGIRVRSTVSTAHGFVALNAEDGSARYLWSDTSGQLRIGSAAESGGTGGTVVGTQTSDERLKDIDGPVEYGLKEVMALEPIKYSFKTAPEIKKLGFSAQKTLSVVPEAVFDTNEEVVEGDPTKLGMEYVALIPVLVNAIKEQQEMIVELKAEVAQLKIRG